MVRRFRLWRRNPRRSPDRGLPAATRPRGGDRRLRRTTRRLRPRAPAAAAPARRARCDRFPATVQASCPSPCWTRRQLAEQPGACRLPVALDRLLGHLQHVARFLEREAAEKTQLGDLPLALIECRQALERGVEIEHV